MVILTVDTPPWPYEYVGLVQAASGDRGLTSTHGGALPKVIDGIAREATRLGAEAVIGLRIAATYTKGDAIWIGGVGTAVKWIRSDAGTAPETPGPGATAHRWPD